MWHYDALRNIVAYGKTRLRLHTHMLVVEKNVVNVISTPIRTYIWTNIDTSARSEARACMHAHLQSDTDVNAPWYFKHLCTAQLHAHVSAHARARALARMRLRRRATRGAEDILSMPGIGTPKNTIITYYWL